MHMGFDFCNNIIIEIVRHVESWNHVEQQYNYRFHFACDRFPNLTIVNFNA